VIPQLIGMVHLAPLPGAPRYGGDLKATTTAAVADAERLVEAGFDAVMVENFGDVPFYADEAPKITIAAMTSAIGAIADRVDVPIGVNVLRNDALGALAVATATGASYIRVNVLSGVMYTDQGPIVGKAAEVARAREHLDPRVQIMADVFVKHAVPPTGTVIQHAAADLVERGLADAVIVSGPATGSEPAPAELVAVRTAIGGTPLLVGSGADASNVSGLLAVADGVIAGTSLKIDGLATNAVDPERAARFVAAAR
jgi:membrane complex biogenesis BtpA family protein